MKYSKLYESFQRFSEEAKQEKSLLSSIKDFVKNKDFDDIMDASFKKVAPNMVAHVMRREVNEDMEEFVNGAIEGRFEKRADWSVEDPSPERVGYKKNSTDYALGYKWGWNNASTWKGNTLPDDARKEAIEFQIKEFEERITEEMVLNALQKANETLNPILLLKTAWNTITTAVKKEGWAAGLKKGLPIAIGILVGEALDNFIIPIAFKSLTGIPVPPLPVGVGEVINPFVIKMVGNVEGDEQEEVPDEMSWYDKNVKEKKMKYNKLYENWQRFTSEKTSSLDEETLKVIKEELNSFVLQEGLSTLTEQEVQKLIREGLVGKIASKLNMKPVMAAMAIAMAMNAGAVKANTGIPQVDRVIDDIENMVNMDVDQDGTVGDTATSTDTASASNIKTFKSTADAEKATGYKVTKAFAKNIDAVNAAFKKQGEEGMTYRGAVKIGNNYHGLYSN